MNADDGQTEVGSAVRPAGFWRRALALIVDLVVVWLFLRVGDLVGGMLARRDVIAQAFRYTYTFVIPVAYFVLTHGTEGQTLGKRLMGARVVGADGEPIGYVRALGRTAATCVSALLLGVGFLAVAVRRDKRGLHDLIAGTRVVRVL